LSDRSQSGFTCDECGRTFARPILATVSGSGQVQKYYACPRCMTKVSTGNASRGEEEREPAVSLRETRKPAMESENSVKCENFFGYLRKRPKDTAIPEECLTCSKMVECLLHQ